MAGYLWLVFAWLAWGDRLPNKTRATGTLGRLYELEPVLSGVGIVAVLTVAAYLVGSIAVDLQNWLGRPLEGPNPSSPVPLPLAFARGGYRILRAAIADDMAAIEAAWNVLRRRDVIKARLMDLSPAAFAELDRLDAEATFRMALWPPLTALIVLLVVEESDWWFVALALPLLIIAQWISRRRRANSVLATAVVARDELLALVR